MKQISIALSNHIAGEVTTLATCWKLTRQDSTILGFTDHDQDITYAGTLYTASSGFSPTAIQNSGTLSVDNMDVEGMLSSGSIIEADILAGLYDLAAIEIFQVNYNDLTQGTLKIRKGWLGEVSFYKQQFIAEVRGLTQKLSQSMGELYGASCRAALGDSRCQVNLAVNTVTGSVTSVLANNQFSDTSRSEASGLFNFGTLTFTSGANVNLRMEVKEYIYSGTLGLIILALPMPYAIQAGDAYSLTKGCDKTLVTCNSRFNNVVNFRGEPLLPGLDRMLETAGTRSTW